MLSSHLLGDLEQVCDHLIVLADGRVRVAGDVADLLAVHHRLTDTGHDGRRPRDGAEVIYAEQTRGDSSMVVRTPGPVPGADPVDLEDIAPAYLTRAAEVSTGAHR